MPADTGGQAATTQNLAPIIQRSRQLDLGGTFDIPPGDALSHFGAGFAKVLASNIFLTGLEPSFAAQNVGYFTAPYEHRKHVEAIDVDAERIGETNALFKPRADTDQPVMPAACRVPRARDKAPEIRRWGLLQTPFHHYN